MGIFKVWYPLVLVQKGGHFNSRNPHVLPWKGVKISKSPLEKGAVFNSQNYHKCPVLIALTLPVGVYPKSVYIDYLP